MRGVCVVIIRVTVLIVPLGWHPPPQRPRVQRGRIGNIDVVSPSVLHVATVHVVCADLCACLCCCDALY